MEEEIIYYLKLLRFLKSSDFHEEDLERITEWLLTPRVQLMPATTAVSRELPINNVIEEVPNRIMAIALVREAKHVETKGNSIIYNKKPYRFNNVYTNREYNEIITQTIDFTNKRLIAGKDTTLIYHGYSGAGKSTLLSRILSNYHNLDNYKLYEVYLNKMFVYFQGMKIETRDIDDPKYVFQTNNILNIMDKFARKRNNGTNSTSSRSHTILEIYFPNEKAKLTCIDLAGNERNTEKALKDETNFINTSLFNLSRHLSLGWKYKEKGDVLLNIIRKTANILITVIFHDIGANLSVNHLMLLKDFLKSIVPDIMKIPQAIIDTVEEALNGPGTPTASMTRTPSATPTTAYTIESGSTIPSNHIY